MHKRIRLVAIRARLNILGLAQQQTSARSTAQCVRHIASARYVRLGAIKVNVETIHCVLQRRENALLKVHNPTGLLDRRTHLADDAVVERKAQLVRAERVAKVHIVRMQRRVGGRFVVLVIVRCDFVRLGAAGGFDGRVAQLYVGQMQHTFAWCGKGELSSGLDVHVGRVLAAARKLGANVHCIVVGVADRRVVAEFDRVAGGTIGASAYVGVFVGVWNQ